MITRNMYVLYDTVTEMAGPVFEQVNDRAAVRSVIHMTKDRDLSDFELVYIGTVSVTGDIVSTGRQVISMELFNGSTE